MSEEGSLPIIRAASWVRLSTKSTSGVPATCRGRDAVVLQAPTKRVEGSSKRLSPTNYETQDEDTVFQVRVRENGALLEVKRSAFEAVAQHQGGLTVASHEPDDAEPLLAESAWRTHEAARLQAEIDAKKAAKEEAA